MTKNDIDTNLEENRKHKRGSVGKRIAKAITDFWKGLPRPIRWFICAFIIIWLSGICVDIYHGRFDAGATMASFLKGLWLGGGM